jgi:hypothetical protein
VNTEGRSFEEMYFDWLCGQVGAFHYGEPDSSYYQVCSIMHQMIFRFTVPRDDNRAVDGQKLRELYLEVNDLDPEYFKEFLLPDASTFEVLVALAHRAHHMVPLEASGWFRLFLLNLNLSHLTDWKWRQPSGQKVFRILRKFNNRTYRSNGRGGLFPLDNPLGDQRKIELWYQMAAYMQENRMY